MAIAAIFFTRSFALADPGYRESSSALLHLDGYAVRLGTTLVAMSASQYYRLRFMRFLSPHLPDFDPGATAEDRTRCLVRCERERSRAIGSVKQWYASCIAALKQKEDQALEVAEAAVQEMCDPAPVSPDERVPPEATPAAGPLSCGSSTSASTGSHAMDTDPDHE